LQSLYPENIIWAEPNFFRSLAAKTQWDSADHNVTWFATSTKQATTTTSSFGREDELVFDTVDGSDGAVSEFLFSLLDDLDSARTKKNLFSIFTEERIGSENS
jgi:hypothetical protein